MKKMLGGLVGAALLLTAMPANAAVSIDFRQVGSDVVATATGTFDKSLSGSNGSSILGKYVYAPSAFFGLGSGTSIMAYTATGAPRQFSNAGGFINYTSSSGTAIGMNGSANAFFIDSSYVSNSQIIATATFANRTLAALGLNPAVYNFDAGGNAITVAIGQAPAVPEPATWGMMLVGVGMIGAASRYRRRSTATTFA